MVHVTHIGVEIATYFGVYILGGGVYFDNDKSLN